MKHILLIHTGGTLGMSGRRPNALKPSTFFRTVKKRVPELTQLAHVEFELFSNVDSCEMQPELWVELAKKIHERLNEFDGIVVTHGTDTLADTASALSFLLPNLKKPVVLTGAQRPLGEIRTDAHLNLIDAVTSAIHGPKEVTVCFDSHLYRGNRVRKMSVSEYDAFDSPNFAKLGVLGVEARFEKGLVRPKGSTLMAAMNANVFLLRVHPG
jgi:L-asparaginase